MSFNHTKIKTININMNKGSWNPETHSIILSYDPEKSMKFKVSIVPVETEKEVTDLSQANDVLKKFRNK